MSKKLWNRKVKYFIFLCFFCLPFISWQNTYLELKFWVTLLTIESCGIYRAFSFAYWMKNHWCKILLKPINFCRMKKSEQTQRIFVYRITESVPFFYFQVIYTYSIRVNNDSYFFKLPLFSLANKEIQNSKYFGPNCLNLVKLWTGLGQKNFSKLKWIRNSHKKIVSPSATANSACRTDAVILIELTNLYSK